MLKNYFKVALRNLIRFKIYSFINIGGLAIGVACCLLIVLYVYDELSFDSFHEKASRIYRINSDLKFGNTELAIPVCADLMGPLMKQDYPQVEEYVRLYSFSGNKLIKQGEQYNNEQGVVYADSTFFKVFTFPVVSGNTSKILNEPNTIVISESMAEKYFGSVEAVGKYLETNDDGVAVYKVTAVIKDMPANSHFRTDFLFPMMNLKYDWGNLVALNFHTYLLLKEGVDYKEFEKNFQVYNDKYVFPFAKQFMQIESRAEFEKAGNRLEHSLIPLTDIHLYSKRAQELSSTGTIEYVYIFSAIALFILLIACINFMNLTTARSANRAREVGIRKVLGTDRKNLIIQFLSESILISFVSVILAVNIIDYVLPYFNDLAGKKITSENLYSSPILIFLLLLPFIIGLIAGSYPAFFLSRFMPSQIIKGKLSGGSKSGSLRSALVVFQFSASIILITGTIIIYNQLDYIQNKKLGYQKDQRLIINDTYTLNNVDAFKNEMLNTTGVKSATISGFLPVPSNRNFTAFFKNSTMGSEDGITIQRWVIDYDYFKTLAIELNEGRNFSMEFGTDSSSIILNETAVKKLGYDYSDGKPVSPVGQKIYSIIEGGRPVSYNIIGVVKDFHFESLKNDIGGLCFVLGKNVDKITLSLESLNVNNIINKASGLWKNSSAIPFSYRFMDDSFNEVYRTEQRVGIIALSFSGLAILVACLGLFGLATFLAERKTKEIGIRKVLGASVPSILLMLSKEFIKWILVANLIAWPIAYYFMNSWLQDFAYRVSINWWLFIAAGIVTLFIALLTISVQALKAATANPVKSLRYE